MSLLAPTPTPTLHPHPLPPPSSHLHITLTPTPTLTPQGNDVGTQYRSGFYYFDDEQKQLIEVRRYTTQM